MKLEALSLGAVAAMLVTMFSCATRAPNHPGGLEPSPTPSGKVSVLTSCGEFMFPPLFAGRVLGQFPDGSTTPLSGVLFIQAIGEDALRLGPTWPTDFSTDTAGQFSAVVGIGTSTSTWYDSNKVLKTEDWVEDVVFELRATNCDPLIVHFSVNWVPHDLTMSCSGMPNEGQNTK